MTHTAYEWQQVFNLECHQVAAVDVNSSDESLVIHFKNQPDAIPVTAHELNDLLCNCNSNLRDTVIAFLNKHGKIIYYKNTLVGFFDIQAYSSFIELNRSNFNEAVGKINALLQGIQNIGRADLGPLKFSSWILSDSIILVIDTDICPLHSSSIQLFFFTCSLILQHSLLKGFPLRGAIGGGDFFKDGEIMVSSALVNASRYERAQNWLGAVITPEAHDLVELARTQRVIFRGKSDKDFSWDDFSNCVRKGNVHWNDKIACDNQDWYYIKPPMIDNNWAQFLPNYFSDEEKKNNSHCLYGEP